jgi:hypothetical protein
VEASIAARVAIKSLLLCDSRLTATLTCEKSHFIMICVRAEHARLEPYVKEEKRYKRFQRQRVQATLLLPYERDERFSLSGILRKSGTVPRVSLARSRDEG